MLTALWTYALTKWGRRFRTRAALEAWQERRIRRHLRWVQAHSPFYRRHWAGHDLNDWRTLPEIDKSLMMAEFDELNTLGIRKEEAFAVAKRAEASRDFTPTIKGVTVGLSSGTSGNHGLFLVSPKERMAWAGAVLAKLLPGSLREEHRIAFFLRASSNLYDSVGQGRLHFEFFDLLEPFGALRERLAAFQPTILVAPPSMLRALAGAGVAIRPRKVISVAEVLDPVDESVISQAFGRRVDQVYQCTEGFLGTTCEHGTLHLNEDVVAIQKEYLDEALGKFVPIVTDFSRTTQPIIRYRLNDILTERRAPCPCGSVFTAIERIEGRCDDLILLPGLDGGAVQVFPDFISRAVAGASPAITEFQVVQHGPRAMTVYLPGGATAPAGGASQLPPAEPLITAVRLALDALWARVGAQPPTLTFAPYDFQPGPRKLRRVERRFRP